jgi:hypothetical protein
MSLVTRHEMVSTLLHAIAHPPGFPAHRRSARDPPRALTAEKRRDKVLSLRATIAR